MIFLLALLTSILLVYLVSMFVIMKQVISWRYKVFIYAALTFALLICVFMSFQTYEHSWKDHVRSEQSLSAKQGPWKVATAGVAGR